MPAPHPWSILTITPRVAASPPETPPPRAKRRLVTRILHAWQLYVLLAPALVYLIVFKYWPMYGAQIAFRDYNPGRRVLLEPLGWGWTTSSPS